jgi:hypothetical protein
LNSVGIYHAVRNGEREVHGAHDPSGIYEEVRAYGDKAGVGAGVSKLKAARRLGVAEKRLLPWVKQLEAKHSIGD